MNFLSHEMRVSGACHGVMLGINLNDKGVEDTRMVRRSMNKCKLNNKRAVKRNGNELPAM